MKSDFTFRRVLQAGRRRLWILLLCVVLTPAAATAVSALQKKEYTAKASLLFRDPQFDQKLFASSYVQPQNPDREAATNIELVSLPTVAARTAKRLGMTQSQVTGAVEAKSKGLADVVSIEATWRSARRAATLANTFAQEYIGFRRRADQAKILGAQVPLRRQLTALRGKQRVGPIGRSLADRLNQLNVLASLQTGNAELVQHAQVPDGPSSPKPVLNAAIGLFLGVILGAGLVALVETLDRRLHDPAEVEQAFGVPVLARLAESSSLKNPEPALSNVPDTEREAFRMLRANLRYFSLSRDIRSLLITSSDPGDGKSTVAWGLTVAAATAGSRTLLIEADLRHPSFAARYGLPSARGLTGVLTGEAERDDAVESVRLSPEDNYGGPERSFDVLLAGPLPPNPTHLVESEQMAQLLEDAERDYDLVVVDTPPVSIVSDAIPLLTMVGGVIVVSRLGTSSRGPVRQLHQQLEHLDAPVLGIVINSANRGGGYGYGYGYGYGAAAPDAPPSPKVESAHGDHGRTRARARESSPAASSTTAARGEPGPHTATRVDDGGRPASPKAPQPRTDPARGYAGEPLPNGNAGYPPDRPAPRLRRRIRDLLR